MDRHINNGYGYLYKRSVIYFYLLHLIIYYIGKRNEKKHTDEINIILCCAHAFRLLCKQKRVFNRCLFVLLFSFFALCTSGTSDVCTATTNIAPSWVDKTNLSNCK